MNFDDKRSFYRMMLNTEVTLTIIDVETNNQLIATCRDLSATGMSIEVSYPIALRTKVRVKVASTDSNIPSLDVCGKVIRVEEESSKFYLIGITIEEVD
jgi:hypothetical protein